MYIGPMAPAATLVVGWLTMFLIGTELFILAPLLPLLAADYCISPTLAGWCVTAFSLAYMATAPLLGYVADRMGRRQLLVCSLLVLGVADLLTAIAPNLPWLSSRGHLQVPLRRACRHRYMHSWPPPPRPMVGPPGLLSRFRALDVTPARRCRQRRGRRNPWLGLGIRRSRRPKPALRTTQLAHLAVRIPASRCTRGPL